MTTYSHVKHKGKNYRLPKTFTPDHRSQCIYATSVSWLNLHTTTKLPAVGKQYMCFQNDSKTSQAAKCIKSRIMTNVINYFLSIDTFEQKCVVLKGILQSPRITNHLKTIGIDQH